ncbi:hypothetical protein ACQ4M3_24275 [Leptolyngbya sp. AN03gr2]|uniref:hypothetical protein n=1 Tax=unclassified Leptolyngbya TaxID=2650499 RepID=UPI003D31C8AA
MTTESQAPDPIVVRVNLTVKTRKEFSCLVSVPADFQLSTDSDRLIEGIYTLVDFDDFQEDNEYWIRGDCSVEPIPPNDPARDDTPQFQASATGITYLKQ